MEVADERKRMEVFVRDLFSKTKDFNLLTKKIVRSKYLKHSNRNYLEKELKKVLSDVIIKLLFEFNVGKDQKKDGKPRLQETSPKSSQTTDISNINIKVEILDSGYEKLDTVDDEHLQKDVKPFINNNNNNADGDCDGDREESVDSGEGCEGDGEKGVDSGKDCLLSDPVNDTVKMLIIGVNDSKRHIRVISKPTQNELATIQKRSKNQFSTTTTTTTAAVAESATATNTFCNDSKGSGLNLSEEKEPHSSPSQQRCTKDKPTKPEKRLSAFEVLQSVLDDSSDILIPQSEDDMLQDTDESVVVTKPHFKNMPFSLLSSDSQDVTVGGNNATRNIEVTPSHSRYNNVAVSDNISSDSALTPPMKVKRLLVVSDTSESNNSPIRMRLSRNHNTSNSRGRVKLARIRKMIISDDSDSKSPFKAEDLHIRRKRISNYLMKWQETKNQTATCDKEKRTVKPFRISLSKKEILKDTNSESNCDSDSDPDLSRKKTVRSNRHKRKIRKLSSTQDIEQKQQQLATSSPVAVSVSSSESESDLKLSQIKILNSQSERQSGSSSSDSEDLLINYTAGGAKHCLTTKQPTSNNNNSSSDTRVCSPRVCSPRRKIVYGNPFNSRLKIIREQGLNSSDSENTAKNTPSFSLADSIEKHVYKMRVVWKNGLANSESDSALQSDLLTCDTATTKCDNTEVDDDELSSKASPDARNRSEANTKTDCSREEEESGDSESSWLSSFSSPLKNVPKTKSETVTKQTSNSKAPKSSVAESSNLKRLKKVCQAAELWFYYKKEFQNLKSDKEKCNYLKSKLREAGMKGSVSMKAADRLRLLREAEELNKDNIISCDSGRSQRKRKEFFSLENSPAKMKNIEIEPENFHNLKGIVDSEASESDMETEESEPKIL